MHAAESSISGSDGLTTQTIVGLRTPSHPTNTHKSKEPPSSTKEKTDKAILCFILKDNDEQARITTLSQSTTSSSITASRDEYIWETKQITAVHAARKISDAVVDYSLQKWKICLKELQEMKKNGISVDHPVFLATKAIAKLHEALFNLSLTTATKAQAICKNDEHHWHHLKQQQCRWQEWWVTVVY
jgi:hypothetical protein